MKKILKNRLDKADFDKLREVNELVKGTKDYKKYYMKRYESHLRDEFSLNKGAWTRWKLCGWDSACGADRAVVTNYGGKVWIDNCDDSYGVINRYIVTDEVNKILGIWEDV